MKQIKNVNELDYRNDLSPLEYTALERILATFIQGYEKLYLPYERLSSLKANSMWYVSGIEIVDAKNKDTYLMGNFALNCIQIATDNRIIVIGYDITEITEDMDYPKIDYETLNNAK